MPATRRHCSKTWGFSAPAGLLRPVQARREIGPEARQGYGEAQGADPAPHRAAAYLDHPLRGECRGFRDLHIEPDWLLPDWLLIDSIDGDTVRFERTGRHADLFDE